MIKPVPSSEKFTAGTHIPYWIDSVKPLAFSKLSLNKEVDVVIIGGGIAGVTIAYCLSKAGKTVALVEDGFIGSGETGRTTAHLVTALDERYYEIEKMYGVEKAKLIAQSHAKAIDFIEGTIKALHIDCDFERLDGYLFLHPTDEVSTLKKEIETATSAGLEVQLVNEVPGIKNIYQGIRFPNQAKFHPLKYVKALCEYIEKNDGSIYTNTHAKEITEKGIVTDEGYEIKAEHIVVATNTPVNNRIAMHLKQYPYRTYVVAAKIKKDVLPDALWWDTGDFSVNSSNPPYHYIRKQNLNSEHDLLIVGGEDHATGLSEAENISEEGRYAALEKWMKEHFPEAEIPIYKWSGQIMYPMDSLAYIGHNPFDKDNVYIVTGDAGNGMTYGTIAGKLITDLITGKENKLEKIYAPSRMKLFSAGKVFLKEFVGGLINYM
ncbi:MAG TPA: FAD-binding oxidoreductase, partial [Bacteroidia bacterium]|nr:FAD-binding oxidoreductase [Bacteroidia bacterium]